MLLNFLPWSLGALRQSLPAQDSAVEMAAPYSKKKIDPTDGKVYSLEELQKTYKGKYSDSEIKEYWEKEMRPAKLLGKVVEAPDDRKVDPADKDLKVYSFKELSKKYQETMSEDSLKQYWENECKSVKLMERPTEQPPLQFRSVFFDQKGSRYHEDLKTLEDHNLLVPGSVVIADNCLKPGAPLYIWRLCASNAYDTDVVSMKEFAMPAEDWMVISKQKVDSKGERLPINVPEAPAELLQLQWESDRIRDKATRSDGGVTYGEWASYSQEMKEKQAKYQIRASHTSASFVKPGTKIGSLTDSWDYSIVSLPGH